jgi:uncharacterized protein YodC (DUF2158 family)
MHPGDIKVGHTVKLKSGGPSMQVTRIEPADLVECEWTEWIASDRTTQRDSFPAQSLILATDLSWSLALDAAKLGWKIALYGWNGKGMWVAYNTGIKGLPAASFLNEHARKHAEDNGGTADVSPCLIMKMSNGEIMIGWSPSQLEMALGKWYLVD